MRRGEATSTEQAYLTDRVLTNEGKPQVYGTQLIARDGRWVPRKLRDPDSVEAARAAAGLVPLAEYLASVPGKPEPMRMPCPQCQQAIQAWPPDAGETSTATCPKCGYVTAIRSR